MLYVKIKSIITGLLNNKILIKNFSLLAVLQVFLLLSPLITYPYLVQVLGKDCYGLIITAQVVVSYFSLVIDFGTNGVCAKYVSINRDNKGVLSEIVCSILSFKFFLFISSLFVYVIIILIIPEYRSHWFMFLFMYTLTFNELLFPQYYFQGLERMGIITFLNISFKLLFILLVFVVIKDSSDYLYVPILYGIGHFIVGLISLYIVFVKDNLKFYIPSHKTQLKYVRESGIIFSTDIITTIKDKLNYLLIGKYISMGDVVIYDLAIKINGLISRPVNILATVLFPGIAKDKNTARVKKSIILALIFVIFMVVIVNIFMNPIVYFFLHEHIDVIPIRLFSLAPIFLSVSYMLGYNFLLAFGHNKTLLYSIIFTTMVYLISISVVFIFNIESCLYAFIAVALISYLAELIYRAYKALMLI